MDKIFTASYIHNNPIEDMIVTKPEDYLFCSAPNYAGQKGMLDVHVLGTTQFGNDYPFLRLSYNRSGLKILA